MTKKNKILITDVEGEGEFYTYQYLLAACDYLLKNKEKEGEFYRNMLVMMLSALSLEAYLNHIGSFLLKTWQDIEKSLSPKSKLNLILEISKIDIDFGVMPFQKFDEIFKYRNEIVHGKTIKSKDVVNVKRSSMPYQVQPKLEKITTNDNARQYLKLSNKMIDFLYDNSKVDLPPKGLFGSAYTLVTEVGKSPPKKQQG